MASIGSVRSSFAVAVEGSYGSLDGNGLPDTSGLSFVPVEVQRDTITYDGQSQPAMPLDLAHAGLGDFPPEPATVYSGGTPYQRRTAEITVRMPGVLCPGAGATVDNLALSKMLRTVMLRQVQAAGDSDTVAAGVPTTNSFPATNPGRFAVNKMIGFTIGGRLELAWVTDVTAGTVTFSPAVSTAPSVGDLVRICQTYYPTLGGLSIASHPSLAVRQDLHDRRYVATGCRLKKLVLEMDGAANGAGGALRVIKPTATLWSPWVTDADGSASPVALPRPNGPYAMGIGSYDVYGTLAAVSAPAAAARYTMQSRRWTVEIDWDLVPIGTSDSGLTIADYLVGGVNVTVRQTLTPVGTFDTAFNAREMFHLLFGAGPTSAGVMGAGMGFGVGLKAACLSEYIRPSVSRAEVLHEAVWRLSPYSYDTGTWAPGTAADSPFTLGWVS